MTEAVLVACPACATLNRVPGARLAAAPVCGRCKQPLFQGRPLTLDTANFERHAVAADLPLLVDFWAGWCGPCKAMAPVFAEASGRLEPQVRLGKLDTEAEPDLARRFGIQSIPTLLLLRKGREIARTTGAMPLPSLLGWVARALGAH